MCRETLCKVIVVVAIAGLGALVGAGVLSVDGSQSGSLALSDANGPIVGCGVIVNQVCSGCRPSAPGDSQCSCYGFGIRAESSDCACRNSTGGLQTGEIVTCETGPFNWREEHPGKNIRQLDTVLCSTTKTCRSSGGTCAYPPPCAASCTWQATQHSYSHPFEEVDPCD
jgi:hypothetical protein